MKIAVVGAGVAGLACARRLVDDGHTVTVFEREDVAGGRVATLRTEVGGFDHGAQYLTARDPAFVAEVDRWQAAGAVEPWSVVAKVLDGRADAPQPARPTSGATRRWVGVPGMAAIGAHLAAGLDVRYGAAIVGIERDWDGVGSGWRLRHRDDAASDAVAGGDATRPSDAGVDGHTQQANAEARSEPEEQQRAAAGRSDAKQTSEAAAADDATRVGNAQAGNAQAGNAQPGNAQAGNAQAGNAQARNAQTSSAQTSSAQAGDAHERYDAVVVALPAPPAAALLASAPGLADRVAGARIEPCWALLVGFAEPVVADPASLGDAAFVEHGRLAWIAREPSKPQRRVGERWTVHAQSGWSVEHFDDDPEDAKAKLLRAFHEATGSIEQPVYAMAYRWRHALVRAPLDTDCLWDPALRIGACGDWCRGHRIEDAWLSGVALAKAVGGG